KEHERLNDIAFKTLLCITSVSILFSLFLYLLEPQLNLIDGTPYLYIAFGITGTSTLLYLSNYLIGKGRVVNGMVVASLCQPALLSILLLINQLVGISDVTLTLLIQLYCLSFFCVSLVLFLTGVVKAKKYLVKKSDDNLIFSLSKVFFVTVIVDLIFLYFPFFLLGYYHSATDVAYYSVCLRVATLLAFVFTAVNKVFAPSISLSYINNEREKIKNKIVSCLLIIIVSGFIFMFICMFFSKNILSFFGSGYVDLSELLLLFVLFQIIASLYFFIRTVFQMTEEEQFSKNLDLLLLILGSGCSYFLVPEYGAYGAVISLISSLLLVLILSATRLVRIYGFRLV
ncbi:MAG: MATE family efflux transporter, partial [Colwellia sp.]